MVPHRKGNTAIESAGKRLCAALVASSLMISTATTARADEPAPSPSAQTPGTSIWGHGGDATARKAFVFGFLGLGLVSGGVALGFHLDGIGKENARQDFIRNHGNVDLNPGPGVQQVGPQCKGPDQCATYAGIKKARDNDYNLAAGLYGGMGAAFLGAGAFFIQVMVDHSAESKQSFAPIVGPNMAGAAWEARF